MGILILVADLFLSGRIVDGIVILMLVELIVLMMVRRKEQKCLSTSALVVNLAAGAALLLSLRAALASYRWQIVASWLFVALLAHALDLKIRWSAK
jgi:hypothetical protein